MADYLMTFEVPKEFKDEEKWFKIFDKKSCITAIVTALIVVGYIKIMSIFGWTLFALISGGLVGVVVVGLTMMPKLGGGTLNFVGGSMAGYIIRRFIHRRNNAIYIKGVEDYREPEDLYEKYEILKQETERTKKGTGR